LLLLVLFLQQGCYAQGSEGRDSTCNVSVGPDAIQDSGRKEEEGVLRKMARRGSVKARGWAGRKKGVNLKVAGLATRENRAPSLSR
jgi:hypothetical protein